MHTQIAFELFCCRESIFLIYSAWSGQIIDDDYHYGRGSFNATWALKHFLNNECYFLVGTQNEHKTGAHSNGTEQNDEMRKVEKKNGKNENWKHKHNKQSDWKQNEMVSKHVPGKMKENWFCSFFLSIFCCTWWEMKKWKSFSFTSCRRANKKLQNTITTAAAGKKMSRKVEKIGKSSAFIIHVEMWKCERKFYARPSILYLNGIYGSRLFGALWLQTQISFYAQKCEYVAWKMTICYQQNLVPRRLNCAG